MTDAGSEEKVICARPDETCHVRSRSRTSYQPYTPLASLQATVLLDRLAKSRTALRHVGASASEGLSTGTMERGGAALIWRSLASASICTVKSVSRRFHFRFSSRIC